MECWSALAIGDAGTPSHSSWFSGYLSSGMPHATTVTNAAHTADEVRRLTELLRTAAWFWDVVEVVETLPVGGGAFVAAGAVRDAIWDALSGVGSRGPSADIDVVYYDVQCRRERHWASVLGRLKPNYSWEVTNQAWVHEWYRDQGRSVVQYSSLSRALGMWPETATAIAVRLLPKGELEVIAPFGLSDLFALVARHNPRQATRAEFLARVEGKGWRAKWPKLKVIDSEVS